MKCKHCGEEIRNDAAFCTSCGKKVEKEVAVDIEKKEKSELICSGCGNAIESGMKFCTSCGKKIEVVQKEKSDADEAVEQKKKSSVMTCEKCGKPLNPTAKFCTNCGFPIPENNPDAGMNSVAQTGRTGAAGYNIPKTGNTDAIGYPMQSGQTKSNKMVIVIIVSVIVAIVVIGLIAFLLFSMNNGQKSDNNEDVEISSEIETDSEEEVAESTVATEVGAEDIAAEATEEASPSNADYDLTTSGSITLTGVVKKVDGEWVLKLDAPASFGDLNDRGDVVIMDSVQRALIDDSVLMENMLESIKKDSVEMKGDAYIEREKVYIVPFEIYDEYGVDLIAEFESKSDDYIIPYSDSILLSESDVDGLTLQEINYAKNEIYARHGRKFASQELQDYFNSKSWYYGTISPEDFDRNTSRYLSDIENKNAAFLSKVETSMGTYQLDR